MGLVAWPVGSTSYCELNSGPENGVSFGTCNWGRNPTQKVGATSYVGKRVVIAGDVGINWGPSVCKVVHKSITEWQIKTTTLEDPKHRKLQISEVRTLVYTESLQHTISDLSGVRNSAITETLNLGSSNSREFNAENPKT